MINLRSPYFVIKQAANLVSAGIKIYVHTGTRSTTVVGYQYELSSDAITPSSGDPYVVFDIAELARDYIDSTFDGSYNCTAVWVNYELSHTITTTFATDAVVRLAGYDGYMYFEEGEQSSVSTQTAPNILQSNTVIYKSDDEVVTIPISQTDVSEVHFLYDGELINSENITGTLSLSTNIIQYVSNTGASYDTFKARVEADSGILEEDALDGVFNDYKTHPCDTILIDASTTGVTKIDVKDISECKYTPYKLTFINKFGALQDLWMFKNSRLSISTQKDEYKSNILDVGSYDTTKHQKKILTKNGMETLSMNSGWYPEEYNEVFKQLHLSDSVWINYEDTILPVNISNQGMEFKNSVSDKLINNNITVEFAFDKINNIR